ncbi:unnamed protein product [Symbiodinium sp. CCMP2456]|nr:unnamed protein product [Symbiodinium sp. CCMP2456]
MATERAIVRGIYDAFCHEWLVVNRDQRDWMQLLDSVQFAGPAERDAMHDSFHNHTAVALQLPALGQAGATAALRLMFPTYVEAAGISNKKSGSKLMQSAIDFAYLSDDVVAQRLRAGGSLQTLCRCWCLLRDLSFFLQLKPADDDWQSLWQAVRTFQGRY